MLAVLQNYGFTQNSFTIQPLGNGLINSTWLIHKKNEKNYVLQKINKTVFTKPQNIADNINLLKDYFNKNYPEYLFVAPLSGTDGNNMVNLQGEYYRVFPFIENSHTIDVVKTPEQAFEAAKQFALFTKLLAGFNVLDLKSTIPDFHNLSLRVEQFNDAVLKGNPTRIIEAKNLIEYLTDQQDILTEFGHRKNNFKLRVTHHDTKISNVLFGESGRGLCVIDLDTVMPGFFVSDVGDMMRTYLCPVSEEEADFEKILIRPEFYHAIVTGYLEEMGTELCDDEKKAFHFAGRYMIYMQALRFLTDFLNNDLYYGCKYPGHNFVRAGNQAVLLKRLTAFNPNSA